MTKLLSYSLLSLFALTLVSCSGHKASPHDGAPSFTKEALEKHMVQASAVRAEHRLLERLVGTWSVQSKMWMDPTKSPEVGSGQAVFTSVLGGRFVRQEYTGSSLGKPYQGLGYLGYDNGRKEFTAAWMDTMTTQLMTSMGSYNAQSDSITFQGSFECPVSGESMASREVWTFASDTHVTLTMFTKLPDTSESKALEVQYIRVR